MDQREIQKLAAKIRRLKARGQVRPYPQDIQESVAELVESGISANDLSHQIGISYETVRKFSGRQRNFRTLEISEQKTDSFGAKVVFPSGLEIHNLPEEFVKTIVDKLYDFSKKGA